MVVGSVQKMKKVYLTYLFLISWMSDLIVLALSVASWWQKKVLKNVFVPGHNVSPLKLSPEVQAHLIVDVHGLKTVMCSSGEMSCSLHFWQRTLLDFGTTSLRWKNYNRWSYRSTWFTKSSQFCICEMRRNKLRQIFLFYHTHLHFTFQFFDVLVVFMKRWTNGILK